MAGLCTQLTLWNCETVKQTENLFSRSREPELKITIAPNKPAAHADKEEQWSQVNNINVRRVGYYYCDHS